MIYSISTENIDKFGGLAPKHILNQLKIPDNYAFAEVSGNEARGLLVFYHSREDKLLLLKWLYVDPEYRENNVADHLLGEMVRVAPLLGAVKIITHIPDGDENTDLYSFLSVNGFMENGRTGRKYVIPLEDMADNRYLKRSRTDDGIFALDRVAISDYRHFMLGADLNEDSRLGVRYPFYSTETDDELFDRRNCFAALDGQGRVNGLFMIEELEEGFYMPVLFMDNSQNAKTTLHLIRKAYANIYEHHPDAHAVLNISSERSLNLITYILPDAEFTEMTEMEYII